MLFLPLYVTYCPILQIVVTSLYHELDNILLDIYYHGILNELNKELSSNFPSQIKCFIIVWYRYVYVRMSSSSLSVSALLSINHAWGPWTY